MGHYCVRRCTSITLLMALLLVPVSALAGTTGTINGVITANGAPVPNATVTASSPSASLSTKTDASGHFSFPALPPDTYTLNVERSGYSPLSQPGQVVQADQILTVSLAMHEALRVIATVRSRGAADIVRPGTTADVYSVTSNVQAAAAPLGGGGSLNQAYSGIASAPGVFIPQGQNGWAQSVYVRGGNYTQLGYEFDGVPVQRAFDQYPGSTVSTLGQQELQVYTGSAPATSQSSALAGYINQVIRTGTYPGFGQLKLGIGTPTFYHQFAGEAGGASPNRLFSYYAGVSGYNQAFRYANQFDGSNLDETYGSLYNYVAQGCGTSDASVGCYANGANPVTGTSMGPNGWALGPFSYGINNFIEGRDAIANIHFGIPHKNDGGRDDVQLLYDVSLLRSSFPTGLQFWGSAAPFVADGGAFYNGTAYPNCATVTTGVPCAVAGAAVPTYLDASVYSGQVGVPLTSSNVTQVAPYSFPSSPSQREFGAPLAPNAEDTYNNNSSVFKVQYQKNIGSNAFVRLYGYTFYSDWLQYGPAGITQDFVAVVTPNYDLISHTRGASLMFGDQLSPQHLLTGTAGYTYASTVRWNNSFYLNAFGLTSPIAVLVSSANPFSGICYGVPTGGGSPAPTYCGSSKVANYTLPASPLVAGGVAGACTPTTPASCTLVPAHSQDPLVGTESGLSCGGAPCEYLTANSGLNGAYNTVAPAFTNASLEDDFKPTDRWDARLGVHYDDFRYNLSDTSVPAGPLPNPGLNANVRQMYTNSWNAFHCFSPSTGVIATTTPNSCPAGTTQGAFSNVSPSSQNYSQIQPRVGVTYTMGRNDVLRGSWGVYVQPASTAFQQYNSANYNLLATTQPFYSLGFTTPAHTVTPEQAFNTDASWEHQFNNTDVSFKLTPFWRRTHNQIFNVLLDPRTNFVSGINVGNETAYGFEFFLRKGDFTRNGLSAQLSYTYTKGVVRFNPLMNGTTALTGVNNAIAQYNAYTSFCATAAPGNPRCGATTSGAVAGPCFTAGGAFHGGPGQAACAPGDIANPYWNAPAQGLLNPSGLYPAYNQLPGNTLGAVASSYIIPNVTSILASYRMNKFAVTPSLQVSWGGVYGSPVQGLGIDPAAGCAPLASGATAGDPRYPYGAAAGVPYDASTCAGGIVTPNFMSGRFDPFGAYQEPADMTANLQLSYDVSPKVTITATMVNVYTRCWGGSNVPWSLGAGTVGCWYSNGALGYDGNFYNPGNAIQPAVRYPYGPTFGNVFQQAYGGQANPFNLFLSAEVKI